jgi:hypothetical protein
VYVEFVFVPFRAQNTTWAPSGATRGQPVGSIVVPSGAMTVNRIGRGTGASCLNRTAPIASAASAQMQATA